MSGTTKTVLLAAVVILIYLGLGILTGFTHHGSVCEVQIAVEVLNGCGQPGIAQQVASHLRSRGFDVMYVGNADDFGFTETLVVDRTGDPDKASAVAVVLGKAPVVRQISSAFFVDVTVVLGADASGSTTLMGDGGNSL